MKAGWQTKKLGDVCEVIGGGTPSKDNAHSAFYSGDIYWATVRDMKSDLISDTEFKITKEAVKSSSTNIIPKGSVVIATRVGLGKVCLIEHDTAINQDLRGIVPKDAGKLAVPFLFWWLKSVAHLIEREGTGATVQGVKLPFIKSLEIPTPPLSEQQRIVAILDEAFEGIATATANAKKNLNNARELFQSTLQSVFTAKGEGWQTKKLGEVCEVIAGQSPEGKYYNNEMNGLPFYQGKKEFSEKFLGEPTTWTTEITKEARQGDVLMSVRAPVGPVNFSTQRICIGRGLAAIRATEVIDRDYLFNFLLKHESEIIGNAGAVFNSINKTQIENIPIPLLSLPEQQRITAKLDELSTETKKFEAIYLQKLTALDALKKSILHQAFAGEL